MAQLITTLARLILLILSKSFLKKIMIGMMNNIPIWVHCYWVVLW